MKERTMSRTISKKTNTKKHLAKPSSKKPYLLNSDQRELTAIYKKLHYDNGWTQEVFAERLEIGSARLASYLYGRTAGVPLHIMEVARNIAGNQEHIKSKFDDLTMPEILEMWAKRLKLVTFDDAKLSLFIGVNVSTVCRWRTMETRPSNIELRRYDAIITEVAERLSKIGL
jgi:hypothetical protein